jgi:hypothetical protein
MELTAEENVLIATIGFDETVSQTVKNVVARPLEQLHGYDKETYEPVPVAGLSVAVEKAELESLLPQLRAVLPAGYHAFWSRRREANGLQASEEIVLLRGDDPWQIVNIKATDGANYGLQTQDIIEWLQQLSPRCKFELTGAADDWVALRFETLPADICAFAQEVYEFCPDSVDQGIGVMSESDDPELFALALELCPQDAPRTQREEAAKTGAKSPLQFLEAHLAKLPPESRAQWEKAVQEQHGCSYKEMLADVDDNPSTEMGIKLLAATLHRDKELFLWWD